MHESYLTVFFEQMNNKFTNEWCVLHSYETLPHYSESDVDMAFSGRDIDGLESLIVKVAKSTGWSLYQKLWYDVETCFYYVLKRKDSNVFLALDFLMDNDGIGRYGFTTKILTNESILFNNLIPIPNPEVAFCYKLVKRIEKQRSLIEDKEYILEQYTNSDPHKIDDFLIEQFGKSGSKLVNEYLKGNSELTKENIDSLKKERKKLTSNLLSSTKYAYWETIRFCNRILYPRGLQITIPSLKEDELKLFVDLLGKRVDILFRFIKFSENRSSKATFFAMAGSTLLINKREDFKGYNAIRYNWFSMFSIKESELNTAEGNVHELVNIYYKVLLQVLHLKLPKKYIV